MCTMTLYHDQYIDSLLNSVDTFQGTLYVYTENTRRCQDGWSI